MIEEVELKLDVSGEEVEIRALPLGQRNPEVILALKPHTGVTVSITFTCLPGASGLKTEHGAALRDLLVEPFAPIVTGGGGCIPKLTFEV